MKRILLSWCVLVSLPGFALSHDTMIIALGGYLSCENSHSGPKPYGIGMYPKVESLIQAASSRGGRVGYLVSCFESAAPPNGEMQYVTYEAPDRTERGNASMVQSEIERLVNGLDNPSVHVIGHSYGGWLSMYLAERLNLAQGLTTLSTVDPISTKCGPIQYIFGMKECKQAPKDLNNAQILGATQAWMNFYQTADGALHSSEIPEAVNYHITYRGPHSEIDSDDRTWAAIQAKVLAE